VQYFIGSLVDLAKILWSNGPTGASVRKTHCFRLVGVVHFAAPAFGKSALPYGIGLWDEAAKAEVAENRYSSGRSRLSDDGFAIIIGRAIRPAS
jgi:hypothetical protein